MSHVPGYVSPNTPYNFRFRSRQLRDEFHTEVEARDLTRADVLNGLVEFWLSQGAPPDGPWNETAFGARFRRDP